MTGRALTPAEKAIVTQRLLAAWLQAPDLRLGQLIVNACGIDPFHIEDEDLAKLCERFVEKRI